MDGPVCLGHLDDAAFARFVERARFVDHRIDARDCSISGARIGALLAGLVGGASGQTSKALHLEGAQIQGDALLRNVALGAGVYLRGASVDGTLTISALKGMKHLHFGAPSYPRTTIHTLVLEDCKDELGDLLLHETDIQDTAVIRRSQLRFFGVDHCRLGKRCALSESTVGRMEIVDSAWDLLTAEHLNVTGSLAFRSCGTTRTEFRDSVVAGWCDVFATGEFFAVRSRFEGSSRLRWIPEAEVVADLGENGPRRAVSRDDLAIPKEPEATVSLESVRFESSAHISWGGSKVSLNGSTFSERSSLTMTSAATQRPKIIDLTETDGASLRLSGVDLSGARLGTAAALGAVEAEGLRVGRGRAGLTLRRVISDEGAEHRTKRVGAKEASTSEPAKFSATYRALRSAAEGSGDYSSANDFFYSEKLWQRRAAPLLSAERFWLTLYGFVGFGVRPWRPIALLAGVVLAAALLFGSVDGLRRSEQLEGQRTDSTTVICTRAARPVTPATARQVTCPSDFKDRLEYSLRSTTGLIRPVGGFEPRGGAVPIDITLRVASALLFALALLGIRNRVHR